MDLLSRQIDNKKKMIDKLSVNYRTTLNMQQKLIDQGNSTMIEKITKKLNQIKKSIDEHEADLAALLEKQSQQK